MLLFETSRKECAFFTGCSSCKKRQGFWRAVGFKKSRVKVKRLCDPCTVSEVQR